MLSDHAAHKRPKKLNVAGVEISIGDLFDNQSGGDGLQAQPAIFLGQVRGNQAKRAHFTDQFPIKRMARGPFLIARGQFITRKPCGEIAKGFLIFCWLKLHS